MHEAALAALLELAATQPMALLDVCGSGWIALLLNGHPNPAISALVCRLLTGWLDDPQLRERAQLQLVLEVRVDAT